MPAKRALDDDSKAEPGPAAVPHASKAAAALAARKMKQLGAFKTSPYPSFARPTPAECECVSRALLAVHGVPPQRQEARFEDDAPGAPPTDRGLADGLVDTVVRTVLGLNTNARNYRVAKRGLDDRFGYGDYDAMQRAPLDEIVAALKPGGLSNVKGKVRAWPGFVHLVQG